MLASEMVQVPSNVDVIDERFSALPPGSDFVIQGRSYGRSRRLNDNSDHDVLVVGDDGVSLMHSDLLSFSVALRDLVAVQYWTDGARTWWGRDGLRVFVHPGEWKDGQRAVETMDSMTQQEIAITMGHPAGSQYLDHAIASGKSQSKPGILKRLRR
jgi:hypothetical protein